MMKKIFSLSIFILAVLFSSAQEIPKWKVAQLEEFIKKTDKPTIINFWATFCKPCIEEIPYFQKLAGKFENEGVQLLLVSLDMEEVYPKIKSFAQKRNFTAPIVFLDETNADLFCPKVDDSWSGALPASLFVNNKTGYRKFFEEQLPVNKVESEIKSMIQPGISN